MQMYDIKEKFNTKKSFSLWKICFMQSFRSILKWNLLNLIFVCTEVIEDKGVKMYRSVSRVPYYINSFTFSAYVYEEAKVYLYGIFIP